MVKLREVELHQKDKEDKNQTKTINKNKTNNKKKVQPKEEWEKQEKKLNNKMMPLQLKMTASNQLKTNDSILT